MAKAEGISRISFNKKTVGSGSTNNSSASFEQTIGEIKERPGTEEVENKRGMKNRKTGRMYKKRR